MTFKQIPGYPSYEVNEDGVVRNINKQRALKPVFSSRYMRVSLYEERIKHVCCIHKLVALTFLGEPEGRCVRHLDGDPTNNSLSNLAYGSLQDNQLDRTETTLGTKLNPRKVRIIRSLHKLGFKTKRLSEIFSVNQTYICDVIRRKKWVKVA